MGCKICPAGFGANDLLSTFVRKRDKYDKKKMRPMAPAMTARTMIFCNAKPPPVPVYRVDTLPAYLLIESISAINAKKATNARMTKKEGNLGTGPAGTRGIAGTFIGGAAGTLNGLPPPIIGGGRLMPNCAGGPFGIFASGGTAGPPPFNGGKGNPPLGLGI